jgi:type I restriction-modification system DNA methylase subunit
MRSSTNRSKAEARMQVSQFLAAIDGISRAHSRSENYRHFMEAAYCMLAKQTEADPARARELEARYMAVVRTYQEKSQVMKDMSRLVGRLALTIADHPGDFLAEAYHVGELADRRVGQYFSTHDIARLHAALVIDQAVLTQRVSQGRPVPFLDPACGSGGMIIAAASRIEWLGFDPRQVMFATLVDLNRLAFQMAFLQMWFKNIPALCIHGDSLTMEVFELAWTPGAFRQRQRIAEDDKVLVLRSAHSGAAIPSSGTSAEHDDGSEQVTPATTPASTTAGGSRRKRRSPRKR